MEAIAEETKKYESTMEKQNWKGSSPSPSFSFSSSSSSSSDPLQKLPKHYPFLSLLKPEQWAELVMNSVRL